MTFYMNPSGRAEVTNYDVRKSGGFWDRANGTDKMKGISFQEDDGRREIRIVH